MKVLVVEARAADPALARRSARFSAALNRRQGAALSTLAQRPNSRAAKDYARVTGPAFYNDVDASYLTYNDLQEDEYRLKHLGLHKCMLSVANSYDSLEKAFDEWKKYAKGREGFIEKLRSAENVDNRLAYLDEYDRETQIAQAKIIERLYDFNEAKDDAIMLGECEYAKRNFKTALRYWDESAKSGVAEGWMRIGKYYSLPEDRGGGPISERSDARAKEAFAKAAACNNQDGVARLSQQALGHVLLRSDDPADWKKALKEFRELADKDSDSGVYPFYYGVAYWKLCLKEWDDRVGYYVDKAKYWYGERDRANKWIDKHQNDYPEEGEYEWVSADLYNPGYKRQTWRYRKFVENWNRAVKTQKDAIANIDRIWQPFENDEKYDLIRKMRDALSYIERAERLNVDGAKEYAATCRSKIKKLEE